MRFGRFRDERRDLPAPVRLPYCGDKPCYDKRAAQTARNRRRRQSRVELRIYHCQKCNSWHLTSKI